eukprot:g715.t1
MEGCAAPIVALLLNLAPEATKIVTSVLEQTPLHYAVRYSASIDVVRMLIDEDGGALGRPDGMDTNVRTDAELKHLITLQPHLDLGSLGKQARIDLERAARMAVPGSNLDRFARRRVMHRVRMRVRNMARSMQQNVIRVAAKRVVVAGQTLAMGDDTAAVVARLDAVRNERESRIEKARKAAKQRRESIMLKKMAMFMRHRVVETVHPMDAIEANSKRDRDLEAAYKRIADKYARECDPILNSREYHRGLQQALNSDEEYQQLSQAPDGRPWWEFLEPGFGVNELFYEQLLREDSRMERDFMRDVNQLHEYDGEDKMVRDALEDANYQLVEDSRESLSAILEFQSFLESVHESKVEDEEKAFYDMAGGKEHVFEIVSSIEEAGSAEIVAEHRSEAKIQEQMRSKELEEEEWWLASELGILDEWDEGLDSVELAPRNEWGDFTCEESEEELLRSAEGRGQEDLGYKYLNEGFGEEDKYESKADNASSKTTGPDESSKGVDAAPVQLNNPQRKLSLRPKDEEELHKYLEQKYG